MLNQIINPSNINLAPGINFYDTRILLKFNRSYVKQDKSTFTRKIIVNLYIFYQMLLQPYDLGAEFSTGNSLFGAIKLTKIGDFDKYRYSDYDIGFEMHIYLFH